jgi:hypothetical protein
MEYLIINGELCHFGIKGQKWGVRRYQNADGTFNEAGKQRYFGGGSSAGGNARRVLAKVYDINAKFYAKNGRNKTLASMNAAARDEQLKKAAAADKARTDKRIEKKSAKYDKAINKVNKEKESILAAREKNKTILENKWAKKEAAGKMTKAEVNARRKDFDAGTAAVKKGYERYASTISNYKKAKVSAITDPSSKKSQASIVAGKAYRQQKLSDNLYWRSGTILNYASEEISKKG